MKTTIITSKGTTTVPKEIREILNIREGSKINFIVEGGRVRIERALTLEEVQRQNMAHIDSKLQKLSQEQIKQRADKLRTEEAKKRFKA